MKQKHFVIPLIAGLMFLLAACTTGPGTGVGNTTVNGQLGTQGLSTIGLDSVRPIPHADVLNMGFAQLTQQVGTQASEPVVRGLNAAMMNEIHLAQLGESTLFGFENQEVVAVDSSGVIQGEGTIDSNGTFSIDVPNDVTVAILLAVRDENNNLVCTDPLEVEPNSSSTEPILLNFPPGNGVGPQGVSTIGLFNFNENSANPATTQTVPQIIDFDNAPEFQNGNFLNCSNEGAVQAHVKGDFDWVVPPDFTQTEDIIYDFSIALGLKVTDSGTFEYVNAAPIDNATGQFDMVVPKAENDDVELSLYMFDVGLLDSSKYGVPLTPIYDLNAALGLRNTIVADNDGIPDQNDCTFRFVDNRPALTTICDYGKLLGGMALVGGIVRDVNGNPVANANVVIILNSSSIVAFNTAITDNDGFYAMLVPATSPDLSYSFGAFDSLDNPTRGGLVSIAYSVTSNSIFAEDIVISPLN